MSKMIVIEAGATTTRIAIQNSNQWEVFKKKGLNGNLNSQLDFDSFFKQLELKVKDPEFIHYYGAGVTSEAGRVKVENSIQRYFNETKYVIHSDVLAACRSCLGTSKGNLAILGTGAIFVTYNGEQIIDVKSGLGIVLGDEGSGAYAGKMLISAFLNGLLLDDTHQNFQKKYKLSRQEIFHQIYHETHVSNWLGQFSYFLAENIHQKDVKKIIEENFLLFFKNIGDHWDKSLGLYIVGGFANTFKESLLNMTQSIGIQVNEVVPDVFEDLLKYHKL